MPSTPKPFLANYLRSVTGDAIFLLCSTQKAEESALKEMVNRRASHYATIVQGGVPDCADWSTWLVNLCVALAPVDPPTWLPMREVIGSTTLESGARGVRSMFTSKPSEKQIERARAVGAFAVRALSCVIDAAGPWSEDNLLLRRCAVSALGLPDEDAMLLCQEESRPVDALELPTELDQKTSKRIASGLFRAAFSDGLDPREDETAIALCQRMGLSSEDTELLRKQARAEVDANRVLGPAAVDAVRYVLSDDDSSSFLARTVVHLSMPQVHKAEVWGVIEHGGAVVLARRHTLERKQREVCLALAWFAALGTNPDQTRLAELMVRHDRVASDLGGEGRDARALATCFVDEQLMSAAQAGGL